MMLMKNQIIKLASVAFTVLAISACDADFDNPVSGNAGSNGDADLSKFVTIGDSITAGYADSALYLTGQENSYPAILAQQFAKVGGDSNFTQPLVSDNLGGMLLSSGGPQIFDNRLVLDFTNPVAPTPVIIAGTPTTEVVGSGLNGSVFSNVGVPGAKSFHLLSTAYGNPAGIGLGANPYFVRFASATGTSMITDAASQAASFFVMWIGNNDVLSYATTGGVGTNQLSNLVDPATYGSNDITNTDVFGSVYTGLVGAMTANPAARGVLVSIPDISTLPFFTTVPYNPVPLDQATADALNAAYAAYNGGVAAVLAANPDEVAARTINFVAGQNAVVMMDEDLTDITFADPGLINMRQATAEDLLLLTTASKIGTEMIPGNAATVWGVGVPLTDGDILIASEIAAIDTARTTFNTTIQAIADGNANLLFFDAAVVMNELSLSGIDYGTGYIDATYGSGGGFSLDGVHPTARGYSVIANRIIETINAGFNASIPVVNPGDYSTVFVQ